MEISLKEGSFYVSLPRKLYEKAVEISKTYENIDLGMIAYLLHLILRNRHNKSDSNEWTSLCSKILNKLNHKKLKVSQHLDILVKENIIEYKSYYNNAGGKANSCKRFKVKDEYLVSKKNKLKASKLERYNVYNPQISKQREKRKIQRKIEAEYNTDHLTKWLKKGRFKIDTVKAKKYVDENYSGINNEQKNHSRQYAILEFENSIDRYSRSGKDDRLHTCFTSLPSDLKQFVTFDGKKIKEADIKTAQPFILTIIIEKIVEIYDKQIKDGKITFKRFSNKIRKKLTELINLNNELDINHIQDIADRLTIMFQNTLELIDFTEINHFISLVRENDIYLYIGNKLLEFGSIWRENGLFYCKLFDLSTTSIRPFKFRTLRDCAKKITINALYSSTRNTGIKSLKDFKSLFPSVFKILDAIKSTNKALLPILMQRIESKCVLDYCAKKIAKKHPKMPLLSRHDSLATTVEYFDIMKLEFQKLLTEYFGIKVTLGQELW